MGNHNSSITRVWPIFDLLFARDPTGQTWFRFLIALAPNQALARHLNPYAKGDLHPELANFGRVIPGAFKKDLRAKGIQDLRILRNCFERDLHPTAAFLEWLIKNPERLSWPAENSKVWLERGEDTRKRRLLLKGGCSETTDLALALLSEKGGLNHSKKWWSFEGATSADCWLETDDVILLIEGKRKEEVSSKTQWFKSRDQVVRNLEVAAGQAAQTGKQFAVLLCAEHSVEISSAAFEKSLPHLSSAGRKELSEGYLGCVTWETVRSALCPDVTLPDEVEEAVQFCLWARRQ